MMYQKVRDKIKTGDLIAFNGKGIISELIKKKTKSDISHVAIVLDINQSDSRRVQIIESTSLAILPDEGTGELIKGVQRHYLSDVLNAMEGKAYWFALQNPLSEGRKARMLSWLYLMWQKRIPYDFKQAIGSAIDFKYIKGLENEPDFSQLFCSEMVAEAYKLAGFLPESYNSSEATPIDTTRYPFLNLPVRIK